MTENGEVVADGRVNLAPVGGGSPAACAIQPDGSFELKVSADRSATDLTYYVTVVGERLVRDKKKKVLFVGPRDDPLKVTAGKENQLDIDINLQDGWKMVND